MTKDSRSFVKRSADKNIKEFLESLFNNTRVDKPGASCVVHAWVIMRGKHGLYMIMHGEAWDVDTGNITFTSMGHFCSNFFLYFKSFQVETNSVKKSCSNLLAILNLVGFIRNVSCLKKHRTNTSNI